MSTKVRVLNTVYIICSLNKRISHSIRSSSSDVLYTNNPNLQEMEIDNLHHLGQTIMDGDEAVQKFGDVKFVTVCGSTSRIKTVAERIYHATE